MMMNKTMIRRNRLLKRRWLLFPVIFSGLCLAFPNYSFAHRAPYSIVYLDINPDRVGAELQIPLTELELAFGNNITQDPETLVERMEPQLKEYILAHTHAYVKRELPWLVEIDEMYVNKDEQILSGPPFWELRVHLILTPQQNESTRKFMFDYDAVVHQVINHIIFVAVRSDWETGRSDSLTEDSNPMTIRIGSDNKIHPLEISLDNGSWWTGFKNMVSMGMQHIKEGTDHLMFLIVLLLPATLVVKKKRWDGFSGTKSSIMRLLKIVTAFTIGHSITLFFGASGIFVAPQQIVEVLIAVSILVSAIHALYPLFPGKEYYVSGGFGLIHGLSFAAVLSNMNLSAGTLALSILGFNSGIEIMQLIIIALIIPWLILLSNTPFYKYFRIPAAFLAGVAAIAWIVQRTTGKGSIITDFTDTMSANGLWYISILACISIIVYIVNFFSRKDSGKVIYMDRKNGTALETTN